MSTPNSQLYWWSPGCIKDVKGAKAKSGSKPSSKTKAKAKAKAASVKRKGKPTPKEEGDSTKGKTPYGEAKKKFVQEFFA